MKSAHPSSPARPTVTPGRPMKIVIPDDYQDMVDQLACYDLIRHHDVTRYRAPATSFEQLVERLRDAEVIVAIRERGASGRALLERQPHLRLLRRYDRGTRPMQF